VSFGGTAFKRHRDEVRLAAKHCRILELLAEFRQRRDMARVPCSVVEDTGARTSRLSPRQRSETWSCSPRTLTSSSRRTTIPDTTLSKVLRESPRPVVVLSRDRDPGEGVLMACGRGEQTTSHSVGGSRALQTLVLLGSAEDGGAVVTSISLPRAVCIVWQPGFGQPELRSSATVG
jgi:hypothetical protein